MTTDIDKTALNEEVKLARSVITVTKKDGRARSQKTLDSYNSEWRRLLDATGKGHETDLVTPKRIRKILEIAKDTKAVKTYFRRRASILHGIRAQLFVELGAQDACQRKGDIAGRLEAIKKIRVTMECFNAAINTKAIEERVRVKTKKRSIAGLPDDWQLAVADTVPKAWRLRTLVAAVTGARPQEIEWGVPVVIDGDVMTLTVKGAKVTTVSGQEVRKIAYRVPSGDAVIDTLYQAAQDAGGSLMVDLGGMKPVSMTTAIRRAAEKLWPDRPITITSYSLRHQKAADMKASDMSRDDVSAALGHCASQTKTRYGHPNQSRGIVAPTVKATRAIKQNRSQGRKAPWAEG